MEKRILPAILAVLLGCSKASDDSQGSRSTQPDSSDAVHQKMETPFHEPIQLAFTFPDPSLPDSSENWPATIREALEPVANYRDRVAGQFANTTQTSGVDSMFVVFRDTYQAAINKVATLTWDNANLERWLYESPANIDSLEVELSSLGLSLAWSEGSAYVDIDSRVLVRTFGPFLSQPMQRFLEIRAQDESEGFSDDAALQITWNQLARRIITWDQFIKQYPDFPHTSEATAWRQIYLDTYFTGMDNSPVFEWNSDGIRPSVLESYRQTVADFPDSELGSLLKEYLKVLAAADYQKSPLLDDFLNRKGISSMMAIQPPIR